MNSEEQEYLESLNVNRLFDLLEDIIRHRHYCPCDCQCFEGWKFHVYRDGDIKAQIIKRCNTEAFGE
jgi:hypothetical protein